MAKRKVKQANVPPGHALLHINVGSKATLDVLVLKPGLRELTIVLEALPARPEANPQQVEALAAQRAHDLNVGIALMKLCAVKPTIVEDDELVDGQLPTGAIHLRDLGIAGGDDLATQLTQLSGFTEAARRVVPLSHKAKR